MLSVIIVSYNTRDLLAECLSSLNKYLPKDSEVIVVDNASEDGSVQMVRKRFPQFRLIDLYENRGFGGANNVGACLAAGDLLWFLNSDAVLHSSPRPVLDFFAHNSVGILGTKLVDSDGTIQRYVCGSFYTLFTPLRKYLPWAPAPWKASEPRKVDWVSGASMFVQQSVMDQLDGFDEQYFMYFEDQDLCYRAKKAGYLVYYFPFYEVEHYEGGSFSKRKDAKLLYYKTFRKFVKKTRPKWESWLLAKLLTVWKKLLF
ncbi:MAG: glycosyltransferase family 2 protein [Patescibacteria group bacterium]